MADITAIILTKNEEVNIGDCIKSIRGIVKRIVVVDSFSTDRTVEIAKAEGAEVYQHKFYNYAKQYMYGVEVAKADTVWTLRIDADERLTEESAKELEKLCDQIQMCQELFCAIRRISLERIYIMAECIRGKK